jgi:transposase
MLSPELRAEILRLYHVEHWPPGTIARHLAVHHSSVRRALERDGEVRPKLKRSSKLEPYLAFMSQMLEKYPRLTASRLYRMVFERGYDVKPSHFRDVVSKLRPLRHREAFLRLRTLPGEEGQVDWARFGRFEIGRASRPLCAFVMVLSYSRALFVRFFFAERFSNFLRGHEEAFEYFGRRLPRVLLYDNLKSAVLERIGAAIRFNPDFLAFAAHHRFEPRPVAPARGNEKGRVERAIGFLRTSFYEARRFRDLEDLNRQVKEWLEQVAMERRWSEDKRLSVREAFAQEKEKLLAAAESPFPTEERLACAVAKTPYVRFDLNDYSVPHELCGKVVVIVADEERVRILFEQKLVAEHVRCYDSEQLIEDPGHIESLRQEKRAASKNQRVHTLSKAAPSSLGLLEALAERGELLGRAARQLEELLRTWGGRALEAAIAEVLRSGALHVQAVRHVLERERRASGQQPPRPLALPEDPRVRDLTVRPHDLAEYDQIHKEHDPDDDHDDEACCPAGG